MRLCPKGRGGGNHGTQTAPQDKHGGIVMPTTFFLLPHFPSGNRKEVVGITIPPCLSCGAVCIQ